MDSIIQGFQLFQKGGAVMYLLLACSLFVVYIGAERSIFYQHMDVGKDFANQFYTQMKLHRYDQARQLAAGAEGVCRRLLMKFSRVKAARMSGPIWKCSRAFSSRSCAAVSIT